MKQELFSLIYLIILTSACDTINQLFLKSAINAIPAPRAKTIPEIAFFIIRLIIRPRVWLSGLFSLLSLFIWLFVLSKADLNFAFSVDSMHYIFIAMTCGFVLRERVCFQRWLGTLSIAIGIVLVSLG